MQTKGVFQFKNIKIIDEIDIKNRDIFDHPILIGETRFPVQKLANKEKMLVFNMDNVNINDQLIQNAIKNQCQKIELKNPHKYIEIQSYEDRIDIEKFSEEYIKLKEEIKIRQKEEYRVRYQNMNTILTQGKLNQENWVKLNKILLEKKPKIWKETANKNRITEDFKKLYKHDNSNKNWDINKVSDNIKYIIKIIQNNA